MAEKIKISAWAKFSLKLAAKILNFETGDSQNTSDDGSAAGSELTLDNLEESLARVWFNKKLERFLLEELAEQGLDAVYVSDNLGIVKIDPRTAADSLLDRPVYFTCSLFDGRFMHDNGVLDSWMSAFSFMTRAGIPVRSEPLASMAIDFPSGQVAFCDTATALKCRLDTRGQIESLSLCKPDSRVSELSQCRALTQLLDIESVNENVDKIKGSFAGFESIADSGPCRGFVEVAAGRKHVYIANSVSLADFFSAVPLLRASGCAFSTFEGKMIGFSQDTKLHFNVLCSANRTVHDKVIKLLEDNGLSDNRNLEDLI